MVVTIPACILCQMKRSTHHLSITYQQSFMIKHKWLCFITKYSTCESTSSNYYKWSVRAPLINSIEIILVSSSLFLNGNPGLGNSYHDALMSWELLSNCNVLVNTLQGWNHSSSFMNTVVILKENINEKEFSGRAPAIFPFE